MGTPRVQHSALPPPAPSRCGAPCLARNSMESLQHRVAVAPPASSAAAASRCGTESPRRPVPRPQQQRLAEPHKRPLRQLRCHYALSGSAARRTPRATARLATSCAGGPSARGSATRLSPSGARPRSNPGTVAADAATRGRRPGPRPNCTGRRPITPGLAPSSDSLNHTNGPCASCAVATHSAAQHARRKRRATARLATSCAGGPSARGAATRLSATVALPRPCPGLLRVGASRPTRRSRARGSEGRAPRRGMGQSPPERSSRGAGRSPAERRPPA